MRKEGMQKYSSCELRHDFDGSCVPGGVKAKFCQKTFSVGVYEWLYKSSGKGLKRTPVKVRVRGKCADSERVYERATEIAYLLDAGEYIGPKIVTVK